MKVYNNILELIGNTPIIRLEKYEKNNNIESKIFAKLECYNPAGSSKDRIALEIIEKAEDEQKLKKGAVIVEPTSGNTGIGLAMIGRIKGYKVILTMPSNMSEERIKLLKAYGAEVVLTDKSAGMKGAIEKAKEIAKKYKNSYIPEQFVNKSNSEAHYKSTGPEIWRDMEGKIDYLIAGIGTGGTLTGTARYLKEKNPNIKIIGIEPEESPMISKGKSASHGIQGIGANFVPEILDLNIIDEIITINTDEAYKSVKEISEIEGILVGISSGAVVRAIKKINVKNKNIVVILPDSGERYLSNNVFKRKNIVK